jgi:hypothetical protein
MAEPKPFSQVKLVCGVIASQELYFRKAEEKSAELYGPVDKASPLFDFNFTDYYQDQMGKNLQRKFLSFANLISPERLSEIKLQTNRLEEEMRKEFQASQRIVNLDPGYLTPSALVMATAKDFAHRIPLRDGIYAHLELLFSKKEVRVLSWTYPDYKTKGYQKFFIEVRQTYLSQLREVLNR